VSCTTIIGTSIVLNNNLLYIITLYEIRMNKRHKRRAVQFFSKHFVFYYITAKNCVKDEIIFQRRY